jgi:hypothetical protein
MPARKGKTMIDTTKTRIEDAEVYSGFGDFLRVVDVVEPLDGVIASPAYVMRSKFGSHRVVSVIVGKRRRAVRLNKFSLGELVRAWGPDTNAWVDKKVRIEKTSFGKLEGLLVVPNE